VKIWSSTVLQIPAITVINNLQLSQWINDTCGVMHKSNKRVGAHMLHIGVMLGGRKKYHRISEVGFPISVPQ